MVVVEKEEYQKLIKELKKHGLSELEIDGVIRGMEDEKNGKLFTPEEVYNFLFVKDKELSYA